MQIELITLAVNNMPEMVAFYNSVFDSELTLVGDGPFYRGTFAGVGLLFCPNDIAGVDAKRNRHQFRISVDDLDTFTARLIAAGGAVINEGASGERKILGFRDIEDNTYEVIQAKLKPMTTYDWQGLMTQWNKTLVENGYGQRFETKTLDWFGTQGATEEQLTQLEQRLGKTLPPSYREFLSYSNGWEHPTPFIYKLWSANDTEWFSVRYQDWIDAWDVNRYPVSDEEYAQYGKKQTEALRTEYLHTALEISDIGDSAIFLLNPQITTPDGEWEAWFFANWLPGARRYRSFWEMMQGEYASLLQMLESFEQTTSKLLAKPY